MICSEHGQARLSGRTRLTLREPLTPGVPPASQDEQEDTRFIVPLGQRRNIEERVMRPESGLLPGQTRSDRRTSIADREPLSSSHKHLSEASIIKSNSQKLEPRNLVESKPVEPLQLAKRVSSISMVERIDTLYVLVQVKERIVHVQTPSLHSAETDRNREPSEAISAKSPPMSKKTEELPSRHTGTGAFSSMPPMTKHHIEVMTIDRKSIVERYVIELPRKHSPPKKSQTQAQPSNQSIDSLGRTAKTQPINGLKKVQSTTTGKANESTADKRSLANRSGQTQERYKASPAAESKADSDAMGRSLAPEESHPAIGKDSLMGKDSLLSHFTGASKKDLPQASLNKISLRSATQNAGIKSHSERPELPVVRESTLGLQLNSKATSRAQSRDNSLNNGANTDRDLKGKSSSLIVPTAERNAKSEDGMPNLILQTGSDFKMNDAFKHDTTSRDSPREIRLDSNNIMLNTALSDKNSASRISKHSNLLNYEPGLQFKTLSPSKMQSRKSIGLDTVDLTDTPESRFNRSTVESQLSTKNTIDADKLNELLLAMKDSLNLKDAMKVKVGQTKVARPLQPLERSREAQIPCFALRLKYEPWVPKESRKHRPLQVDMPKADLISHVYAKPPKGKLEREDTENSKHSSQSPADNHSQRTRPFRIKGEAKKSNQASRNNSQPQYHVVPAQALSARRQSQTLSESSEKTKKRERSPAKIDLTPDEQELNNMVKKLEPLFNKYQESSQFSNDRPRLRSSIAERLKTLSPLFRGFSIEFVDFLVDKGQFAYYPKESMLFNQGDITDRMGIVMFGIIQFNCDRGLVTLTHSGMLAEEAMLHPEAAVMNNTAVLTRTCIFWLPGNLLSGLLTFCETSKRRNEYILFVAQVQRHLKLKS